MRLTGQQIDHLKNSYNEDFAGQANKANRMAHELRLHETLCRHRHTSYELCDMLFIQSCNYMKCEHRNEFVAIALIY